MQTLKGIEYSADYGNQTYSRSVVNGYHGSLNALEYHKTRFSADVVGLPKGSNAFNTNTEEGGYKSRFTIGFEVEKNAFHRSAMPKPYALFKGFERDGSCGYEAITHILPLLPPSAWRNKIYSMMVEAEKIIDSRFSRADDKRDGVFTCGGHVNLAVDGMSSEDLRQALRPYSGLIHAIFEQRLKNRFCGMNLRMQTESEASEWVNVFNRPSYGNEKYQVCKLKGRGVVEFRVVSKFDSVKQMMRRYELFYLLVDFAINRKGTFDKFLKVVTPTLLSMYDDNAEKVATKLALAKHYQKFINSGVVADEIARFLPQPR